MKTCILTTAAELREGLEGPSFTRMSVDCRVVDTGAAVLKAIDEHAPALVIISRKLPDIDGLALGRQIRKRHSLNKLRLLLAVPQDEVSPALAQEASDAGFDDVLEMPLPKLQLYDDIARFLRLPRRLTRRIRVDLVTEVEDVARRRDPVANRRGFLRTGLLSALSGGPKAPNLNSRVVDISEKGARLIFERRPTLEVGNRVHLSLASPIDGEDLSIDGKIAWLGSRWEGGGYAVGVQFDHLGKEERLTIRKLIQWDIIDDGDWTRVVFYGEIVEETTFGQLSELLFGKVLFDMGGVRYLNSRGILGWTRFLEGLKDVTDFRFVDCSTAFVLQASFTPALLGAGKIASAWLPLVCAKCAQEDQSLVQMDTFSTLENYLPTLPPCRCGGRMELDELPERMLAFLDQQHTGSGKG